MKEITLTDITHYDLIYSENLEYSIVFDEKDRFMIPLHNSYIKIYRNKALSAMIIVSFDGSIGFTVDEVNEYFLNKCGFKIIV